ncbi:MAG: hypothetical protein COB38_03375 [Gammaproteobacteria bacterium]|nr:MAG: hypothetical protein COB38_03375 [Gammaproteobacteria bacterium]
MSLKRSLNPQSFSKTNILFVYLIVALLSFGISYSVFNTGSNLSEVNHKLTTKQLPVLNDLAELKHWLTEQERILYEHYAEVDKSKNEPRLILASQNIQLILLKLKVFFPDNIKLKKLESLNLLITERADEFLNTLDTESGSRWNLAREDLASISRMGRNSKPYLSGLVNEIQNEISLSNTESSKQLDNMSLWVFGFSSLIILLAIFVGYFVRSIANSSYEKRKLALFVEQNPNPVASVDWSGKIDFENISWRKNFKISQSRIFEKLIKENLANLKVSQKNRVQWQFKHDKEYFDVVLHQINHLDKVMIFVEKATERVTAIKELEYLAFYDPLTGLGNLRKLELDVEKQLKKGTSNKFYLLAIGIKSLKLVTSTHGLSVSDALMKSMVVRVQNTFSPLRKDFNWCKLYRFTGAKFMILLAEPTSITAHNHVLRDLDHCLLKSMAKPLQTLFGSFFLDIQSGCVEHPEHGYSSSMLIKNANAALSEAQKLNRNQLVLFDHEISYREQKWYQLENDLKAANFDSEFFLVYQPKIDLSTGEMKSMEALIRWQHPTRGLISPVEFIPVAEESGMLMSLGHWALCAACEQAVKWQKRGLTDLQVAVNVSPSQLLSANFAISVMRCLEETGLDAKNLEIEITEEVLASEHEVCFSVLDSLRQQGISIAIDDFGTGYSSLSYLNKFPISKLKIDRSFVTEIESNPNNHAIVSAIIALSHNLGISVIAEGIETKEELAVLEKLDCEIGQGYYFSKPLEVKAFGEKYLPKDNILEINRYS